MKKKIFQQKDFELVKTLLNAGAKIAMTCKATKWSYNTVSRVSKSKNFEEYRQLVKKDNERVRLSRKNDIVVKGKAPKKFETFNDFEIFLDELKAQTEELRKLRGQLVGIEAQINTLKTKKKWL